jgi:hypothetical protein
MCAIHFQIHSNPNPFPFKSISNPNPNSMFSPLLRLPGWIFQKKIHGGHGEGGHEELTLPTTL